MPYQTTLHGQAGTSRKLTEAKNSPTAPIYSEYFLGIQRCNFGFPYPTPLNGQAGGPRKLTESKNIPTPTRNQIFPSTSALQLRVAVPDHLHEQTGSQRKPNETTNIPIAPIGRVFFANSALQIRLAVPEPLTWTDRKPAEAKNSTTPLSAEYSMGIRRCDFGLPYPAPLHGQNGSHLMPTEAHGS